MIEAQNAFGVGLTHDGDHLNGMDFSAAVSALALRRGAVDFDELREVAAVVQRGEVLNHGTVTTLPQLSSIQTKL
jgi:hypothetical protein